MRSYNTDVAYLETCPAKKDREHAYLRHHRWRAVKGSDQKHPTKPGFYTSQKRCTHCGEVTLGEYTHLSLG